MSSNNFEKVTVCWIFILLLITRCYAPYKFDLKGLNFKINSRK